MLNGKKEYAIQLRKMGKSISEIHNLTSIPCSTLSVWLKHVSLTHKQKLVLQKQKRTMFAQARIKAQQWHRQAKLGRISNMQQRVHTNLSKQKYLFSKEVQKIALALLYHGEGSKGTTTSLGSSDPTLLLFFISTIQTLFAVPKHKITFYINGRADHDPETLIQYWSRTLAVPKTQFKKPTLDKRTHGKPSRKTYFGVCTAYIGRVDIQRELLYLSEHYCHAVSTMRA